MPMLLWKDDPAYPLNAEFLARQLDIRPGMANQYMTVNATKTGVIIKKDTIIPLKSGTRWKAYIFPQDTEITTLDTGTFTLGVDYYVYLCDNGDNGLVLISANSTAPEGFHIDNSRKIGGFHYGRVRGSITINDVITTGAVVPNSVWDLRHRPKCSPEGMVYIGNGVWVDIYLSSVNEPIIFSNGNGSPLISGSAKSVFNAIPLTGSEGLSGFNFIELAARSGKRLLTLEEWLQAAYGSPQGGNNNNAWSNASARAPSGTAPYAISLMNVVDCVGNVWEWLNEFVIKPDGTSSGWYNPMPGMNVGQLFTHSGSIGQVSCGGMWLDGANAGSRSIDTYRNPWSIAIDHGARMACDSL